MDKSSIIGSFLGELGDTVKKGAEQVVAKGEFAPPKTQPEVKKGNAPDVDIATLKTEEERDKAKNLAAVRQNLAQQMAPPSRSQELRPQERVERERQREMQELEQKEAKKPPRLAVERAQNRTEKRPGSG